ncbi:APBA1 protein, partial [Amia calva]|nr:APBA1 protein [Amia calva]
MEGDKGRGMTQEEMTSEGLPLLASPLAEAEEEPHGSQVPMPPRESASPSLDELDSFKFIEPPPLDWRSESSSDVCSVAETDDGSFLPPDMDPPEDRLSELGLPPDPSPCGSLPNQEQDDSTGSELEEDEEEEQSGEYRLDDEDHTQIQALLAQLQTFSNRGSVPSSSEPHDNLMYAISGSLGSPGRGTPNSSDTSLPGLRRPDSGGAHNSMGAGLLFSEMNHRDLLDLLDGEVEEGQTEMEAHAGYRAEGRDEDSVVSVSYREDEGDCFWDHLANGQGGARDDTFSPQDEVPEPVWLKTAGGAPPEERQNKDESSNTDSQNQPAYKNVPGPCDPEDLLDGVIFGAKYLGSTQLMSDRTPSTNARMAQAQEAVDRIKAPEGESQPMTEVDLFISTQRIKVLSADTQEAMMDHSLQMISYIADIGTIVVLMARRKPVGRKGTEVGSAAAATASSPAQKKCCMICHVFSSEDAQLIAQAIGQSFGVAYQQFLQANGIKPSELRPSEYSDYLGTQELYNGDLVHFSRSENIREVLISKARGEILGLAVVESGWGSILPTVVVANLLHGGPAERSGELSIGDRVMSVNGTSLVGLPIATCHSIIRDLKNQEEVKLSIVHCPPVTMAIIKRPDPKYQLGFSVEDGIICSLMRGGIAERGGIRVGHRIIEINGQSVVATPHEKIIHILTHAVGEIHLKTMPASTYRLLTGQEQPVFL